jgi:hypothetical protein
MFSASFKQWSMHRQDMLWAALLFFTGMRPGEAAYSSGHKADFHYLRVQNIQVRRAEDDDFGIRFSILIEVTWTKHNRFTGET